MGPFARFLRLAPFVVAFLLLSPGRNAGCDEKDPVDSAEELLDGPKHEEAVAKLRKVIASLEGKASSAREFVRLGRAHWLLEETDAARAAFGKAAARAPKEGEPHFWLGVTWQANDLEKARGEFETAVRLDPKAGGAWLELGKVRRALHDDAAALAAFRKAAELRPDDFEALYLAGSVLFEKDRGEEAVGLFERALALQPDFVNAAYNAGLIHYLAGRFEKALQRWTSAAEHAPKDLDAHAKVVQALYALRRYDVAKAWRDEVRKIRETSEDPETRGRKEFCFDQFKTEDGTRVFAYERFEPRPAGAVYVFRLQKDGKELDRVILLENGGPVVEEMGGPAFFLAESEGDTHTTLDRDWKEMPPYPELVEAVRVALRGGFGGISSRRTPK